MIMHPEVSYGQTMFITDKPSRGQWLHTIGVSLTNMGLIESHNVISYDTGTYHTSYYLSANLTHFDFNGCQSGNATLAPLPGTNTYLLAVSDLQQHPCSCRSDPFCGTLPPPTKLDICEDNDTRPTEASCKAKLGNNVIQAMPMACQTTIKN
eukprot:NODE_1118_length_1274_cov_120.203265_g914_i0.p2 GENE.NODE_1118_length_1274_cov_120.203265_g914_i0~~NODE_1118_length_1274_cov_120.203265_g914_i0.p2  ORF type:complete len:152 (+),score=30.98 NODE_1118_length_1274_cov_120.203265_g914_i0:629-1084(+)